MTEEKFHNELQEFYKNNSADNAVLREELRRTKRSLVWRDMIFTILLVMGVFYLTYQTRTWKEQVALTSGHTTIIKQELSDAQIQDIIAHIPAGKDGKNGVDGKNGTNGANGRDGTSVTADQIASAITQYIRLNPVQALVGPRGQDGGTPLLNVDSYCNVFVTYPDDNSPSYLVNIPNCRL